MPEVAGGAALLINPLDPRTIAPAISRLEVEPAQRRELEKVLATIQEPLLGPDVTVSNPQLLVLLYSFGQGLSGA